MLRWLKRLTLLLVLLLAIALLAAWWLLRGSLPRLDGEAELPGLSAAVVIGRDGLGTVTIEAASETDALRALGFVHAQERYFEMDLMRRTAAGELSALFGPMAVETDRRRRMHRMRARVDADLAGIAGERMLQLQAYTDGVNAGREALRVRPWPYLLLRRQPEPWRAADSALTGFAMYFDLQDAENQRELALLRLRPHLPPALYALVTHDGSRWDAPLEGEARGDAILPGPDQVDLRALPAPEDAAPTALHGPAANGRPAPGRRAAGSSQAAPSRAPSSRFAMASWWNPESIAAALRGLAAGSLRTALDPPARPAAADLSPGSNSFAVAGALTADGRAIVANDMHLGLRAPNIWFRARLRYPDPRAPDGRVDVAGFTLPGLPAVVVGSNTHVAWGFTNSYIDTLDWHRTRPCSAATAAAQPEPCERVVRHQETIGVAGSDPVVMSVEETAWGPILHHESDGSALALRWVAHQPGALNLGLLGLARTADLDEALAAADRTAIPTQNLLLADRAGRIAWRLLGPVAQRDDRCDPGAEACAPWSISTASSPLLASPEADRLWTANSRMVDGEALQRLGDGGYALGIRAYQIRDALVAGERYGEHDLLAIQLDDHALLLGPWWQLLRGAALESGETAALRELADAAAHWEGRAAIDSASYRIVRAWRLAVHQRIADGLLAPAREALADDFAAPALNQLEGVVWPLLEQRPAHLLPRAYASWTALLEDAAAATRADLLARGPLHERTWGERNTASICHPLAGAVPLFGRRMLCMPADPLPGDGTTPRVQSPGFGASERMVVAPGREHEAIAHMPGGQSGHPLSPFWGAGHAAWVEGTPSPFLPGEVAYSIRLRPASPD